MSEERDTLRTAVIDGALLMRLHRPRKRNAVNTALADQLDAAFARLEVDADLRVGVLSGSDGYFSAGTDLTLDASPATADGGEYGFVRRRRTKPVIAAVEGFALGGGLEMVLACDLVVAARGAHLGLPEVRRGVVANCGALFRAPEKLPTAIALELLLTGEPITAERAYQVGFVNRLVGPGTAEAEAMALARLIARNSPAALTASIRALDDVRSTAEATLWPATERAAAEAAAAPDRAEGIAAFFERRTPQWR